MANSLIRKPMASAKRVSFFHRTIQTGLSSAAVEILFGQAQLLSEGQLDPDGFYGSTMVTIDCRKAASWVSDPCDATTVRQVGALLLRDDSFCARARAIGEREARRLSSSPLGPIQIEMHMRTSGNNLHVDIDVEATIIKARAS